MTHAKRYFWNSMIDMLTHQNRMTELAWLWAWTRRQRLGEDGE